MKVELEGRKFEVDKNDIIYCSGNVRILYTQCYNDDKHNYHPKLTKRQFDDLMASGKIVESYRNRGLVTGSDVAEYKFNID